MRSRLRSARTLLSLATLGWVAAPAATATPTAGPATESASAAAPAGATAPLSFNEHVQPILWENC